MAVSFLLTLWYFTQLIGLPAEGRSIHQSLWTWFDVGGARVLGGLTTYKIEWAYKFDVLSACMALLVSGVGFLIHLFSTGYMAEERNDGRYYRFMAYMNLFVFSMMNLVLGANILMMFLGWEGVGLCSYLLIGFYFEKDFAAAAGKKAFVTNRIGDFGFMIGFFLIFQIFGSLDYDTLMGSVREIVNMPAITLYGHTASPTWWFNLAGCCLFVGAMGKSAQIPLYVWLPDAMAGPTPVSALIHAATMVTSGLYMITRMNFIYVNAPVALAVVLAFGRSRPSWPPPWAWPSTTSRRCSPTPPCPSWASCSWAWAPAPSAPACSTSLPTPPSRPASSSAPVRSSPPATTSRTCATWAA